MTTAEQIEQIVRQVLAELGLGPAAAVPSASPAPAVVAPQPAAKDEGVWTVASRVVTLADLPERWNGVRRVVVTTGAVVTPAVVDELQRKNVALAFGPADARPQASGQPVVLAVAGSYDVAPLAKALGGEGYAINVQQYNCLIKATDELAQVVAERPAVLLTRHTAAALCLANRHAALRAVLGARPESVGRDADAVGANLLVLDTAQGFYALRQTARQFLRGGLRQCPEVFRSRLG